MQYPQAINSIIDGNRRFREERAGAIYNFMLSVYEKTVEFVKKNFSGIYEKANKTLQKHEKIQGFLKTYYGIESYRAFAKLVSSLGSKMFVRYDKHGKRALAEKKRIDDRANSYVRVASALSNEASKLEAELKSVSDSIVATSADLERMIAKQEAGKTTRLFIAQKPAKRSIKSAKKGGIPGKRVGITNYSKTERRGAEKKPPNKIVK